MIYNIKSRIESLFIVIVQNTSELGALQLNSALKTQGKEEQGNIKEKTSLSKQRPFSFSCFPVNYNTQTETRSNQQTFTKR